MKTIHTLEMDSATPPGEYNELLLNSQTETVSDYIHVNQMHHRFERDYSTDISGPPTLCIAIFLKAAGTMAIDQAAPLQLQDNSTIVFSSPKGSKGWHHVKAGTEISGVDLRFQPSLLEDYNIRSLGILSPMFQTNCSFNDDIMLSSPTTADLAKIAREIVQCDLTGFARKLFLQAKALEALSQIVSAYETSSSQKINVRDQRLIQKAISILNQQYGRPWTIAQLAKTVGLNEKKLKQGFRQQVQSTIHNYLEQVRLNAACELLQKGQSITAVAQEVGYSSSSHFTRRFKKSFEVTPKAWLQRTKLSLGNLQEKEADTLLGITS